MILLAVAIPVAVLAQRARLPTVAGFLLAGVAIGPSGLALISGAEIVSSSSLRDPSIARDADDDAPTAAREVSACLAPLMQTLALSDRQALELTELESLSQKSAAERLGLSTSGMKSKVQRGRVKLKQALLDCCHIELDRRRGVVDYARRASDGGACACECPPDAPSRDASRR